MAVDSISLVQVRMRGDRLCVDWADGKTSEFHPIWLRDNCRCEACGEPVIGYRRLRLTQLDLACRPAQLDCSPERLRIDWDDGHVSEYAADWLMRHAYDDGAREQSVFRPPLWDDDFRRQPPSFDYTELDTDAGLLAMLQTVRDHGICFVQDAPVRAGIAESLSRRFGFPQEPNSGLVQDLRFNPDHASIAQDIKALKPHTDEPYRAAPPGIMMFHCLANDQTGAGGSLFVDGFEIAERLRAADADGFAALCRYPQAFRRHFAGDVDLVSEFPMISVDEFGHLRGVRINDRVAAPLSIAPQAVETYYRGLRFLLQQSEDPALAISRTLKPGDIVIFDNHRILHGRTDLTVDGQRWLQWIQVKRGDFHSSLRVIADRLGRERDARPMMRGAYG